MPSQYKYRIYCITENTWVYKWAEFPISTCPNDASHTVNPDSVSWIEEMSDNIVTIKEETIPTGGRLKVLSHAFTAAPNTITQATFSHRIPLNILVGNYAWKDTQENDSISIEIGPDTLIGYITANTTTTDVDIHVSSETIQLFIDKTISTGMYLRLKAGGTVSAYYQIISYDVINNTIELEDPIGIAFLASTPTRIEISIFFAKNVELGVSHPYSLGENKVGSSYLPANIPFRYTYNNTHATDSRRIVTHFQCLY